MSISVRLEDNSEREAENALISYVAYRKLTGGAMPRAETLKRLGAALGMRYVQAERILKEAERAAQSARETTIKAAKIGDVNSAFALIQRDRELNEILGSKEDNTHGESVNTITIETISSKVAQTVAQSSISAIRGIRSLFRKIEKATRPNDEQ